MEIPSYLKRYDLAISIATKAHRGQIRNYGRKLAVPYLEHPINVATLLFRAAADTPSILEAAILHDVLEDSDWTEEMFREAGISEPAIELVKELTKTPKPEDRSYSEYIRDYYCKMSSTAALIKIADRRDNLLSALTNWKIESVVKYAKDTLVMFDSGEFDLHLESCLGERNSRRADLIIGTEVLATDIIEKFGKLVTSE